MTTQATSRRMRFLGPGKGHEEDLSSPPATLQTGEVLVALSLATICGSDLHTYLGRRTAPSPCVLGHEGTGTVIAIGPERDEALVGQRVTWSLADSCGHCPACQTWNLPQKCASLFKYGHASLESGSGWNGCFASHVVLRRGTTVIPLPDSLPDVVAAPANCALATMVAVTEAIPCHHHRVLILGAGLLGLYGSALLREKGHEVIMIDPNETRRQRARAFGAKGDAENLGSVPDQSMDAVIEVAGVASIVSESLPKLRPGGHLVLAGLVHPDSALDLRGDQLIQKCVTLHGVHNYGPQHLERGIDWLHQQRNAYPFAELVSSPLPLRDLDEAFALAQSRQWHRVSVSPTG